MQFDDINVNDPELQERLSSWRRLPGVVEKRLDSAGEPGINELELRVRQKRVGNMCFDTNLAHQEYYARLEDFVNQQGRSANHQQRAEDMAAFTLGVYEQTSARLLERSIQQELDNLPKEIIQTIPVPAPQPPKSWLQRLLGL